ncbi:MAG: patatin-like phospholipase family protein, partial [Thermodesulfobacteriota bacterium]|nr:patatin-like phospholipase family protein [Thermodesulfobacteriota bacterium]
AYIHQSYVNKMPSAREVSMEGSKILDAYLDKDGEAAVFSHPFFRLNMVASRCRWPLSIEKRPAQMCAMLGAASINALHRNALGIAVSRTLFYDHRDTPPPMNADAFSTARVALDASNIRSATLASGSIPVVMEGVRDIPGAKPGMYRDGGLCDYHMDLPLKADRIILFPHYVDRLVPGWFDKHLFWRHSSAAYLDWVVLLCPSHSFIRGLYYKKIPDRDDFKQLENNDRIDFWNNTVEQSARLGEEFLENIEKDGLRQKVRPLSSLPNF